MLINELLNKHYHCLIAMSVTISERQWLKI